MGNRVLLIEDDESIRFAVARHLERSGFAVAEAESCESARDRFKIFEPSAIVTDFRLPDGEGLALISEFRAVKPSLAIVVFTGYGSIELAVQAMKTGADHLLTKPVDLDKLVLELRRASADPVRRLSSGSHRAVDPVRTRGGFDFKQHVQRLKNVDCSLLILGETGTGKTLFARCLHEAGARKGKPFVDLNCAGLARDLVESELFGHERGAFTSAITSKEGMFELADGGTLFLDEIGDIDLAVQPKVLKAIEEKRFRRIGGTREKNVDVRVVAATHVDLRESVRNRAFRADLYYRMSTVTITIPPLRDRRAEIPELSRELITSLSERLGRNAPELSPETEAALVAYSWPGNIRELKNVLERALYLTPGDVLHPEDVLSEDTPTPTDSGIPSGTLREAERVHIERALASYGNVAEAARSLGISRSSLYAKVKTYGLAKASERRIKITGSED